ncbi:hypothetical protein CKA32_002599 [Geitlerinema sp. FC II]|nr:hypothetical protein CKA32_002599 [Geitlerinema sp. FC II]
MIGRTMKEEMKHDTKREAWELFDRCPNDPREGRDTVV